MQLRHVTVDPSLAVMMMMMDRLDSCSLSAEAELRIRHVLVSFVQRFRCCQAMMHRD